MKECFHCGTSIQHRAESACYCWSCQRYKTRVQAKVSQAVRAGLLPSPKGKTCFNCGADAYAYDHRDYGKPLKVKPVCRRCNLFMPAGRIPISDAMENRKQEEADKMVAFHKRRVQRTLHKLSGAKK